jgi:hypothetical protein
MDPNAFMEIILQQLVRMEKRLERIEESQEALGEELAEVRANQSIAVDKVDTVPNPFK